MMEGDGSLQGVRHSLGRLTELAKVQSDHEELTRVIAAVEAEVAGLEACDSCAGALERDRAAEVAEPLAAVIATRPKLLAPQRLDARLMEFADRFVAEITARSLDLRPVSEQEGSGQDPGAVIDQVGGDQRLVPEQGSQKTDHVARGRPRTGSARSARQ